VKSSLLTRFRSKMSAGVAAALLLTGIPLLQLAQSAPAAASAPAPTGMTQSDVLGVPSPTTYSLIEASGSLFAGLSGSVQQISDPTGGAVPTSIPVTGTGGSLVAVSPDGSTLYAASADGTVEAVSLSGAPQTTSSVNIGVIPSRLILSHDGSTLWILSTRSSELVEVSTASPLSVVTTFATDAAPISMALSNDDRSLYIAASTNTVKQYQTSSLALLNTITVGPNPIAIALTPSNEDLIVATFDDQTVTDYSLLAGSVGSAMSSVVIGAPITALAVNPDGLDAVVSSASTNQVFDVSLVNALSLTSTSSVTSPSDVTFSADGSTAFVSSLDPSTSPNASINVFAMNDNYVNVTGPVNYSGSISQAAAGALYDGVLNSFVYFNPMNGVVSNQINVVGCIGGSSASANGYLWTYDQCSQQATVYNLATGQSTQISQSNGQIFCPIAGASASGTSFVVADVCGDVSTFSTTSSSQLNPQPCVTAVAQSGSISYIAQCFGQVMAYDASGNNQGQAFAPGCVNNNSMAATPTLLFVNSSCSQQIFVYSTSNLQMVGQIPGNYSAIAVAGPYLYAALNNAGGVDVINESTLSVQRNIPANCASNLQAFGAAIVWTDGCHGGLYYASNYTTSNFGVVYQTNNVAGITAPVDSSTYTSSQTATVLAPNGDQINFGGWSTTQSGAGTYYAPGDPLPMTSGTVTLYARPYAHITYDANGLSPSDAPVDATAYPEGPTATVLAPLGDNALFSGWNTAADGSGTSYAPGATIDLSTGDVTLYAQWAYTTTQSGGLTTVKFNYSSQTPGTYVVPAGVTSMSISVLGAEGGRGGTDASGRPDAGGYQGDVEGTISVTPGEVLTVGVGGGGHDSIVAGTCTGGVDGPGDPKLAVGGLNPLGGYGGGLGGSTGYQGCSGYGGSGGAASVIELGSSSSSLTDLGVIVAGGSGGSGGSGQYPPNVGRISQNLFQASTDSTIVTNGSNGLSVYQLCHAPTASSCDGGGGAGGGGGAVGGDHGDVQFGSGSSNEWYGLGGYPGQNSTGGQPGLTASYVYYSDNNANGSVTVSFFNGLPGAPTNVNAVTAGSNTYVSWLPPVNTGSSAITDYIVRYSSDGGSTWTTVDTGSTRLIDDVTGLSAATNYKFEVAAVNGSGQGDYSSLNLPPDAPTITNVDVFDSRLGIEFTTGSGGNNTQASYQYSLDGGATWHASFSTQSPVSISGLTNGTAYAIQIRAVTDAGVSPSSNVGTGTPFGNPFFPDLSTVVSNVGDGQVDVSWAPANDNGSAITSYTVQAFDTSTYGSQQATCTTSTTECLLTGLTDGTTYYLSIQSQNAAGYSLRSDPRIPVTPAADAVVFNANGGTSTLSSLPYFTGGAPLTMPTTGVQNPGYVFGGWSLTQATPQDVGPTFTPTGIQTLYAMWTPGTYTVTFDDNGGTGTISPESFTTGQTGLALPTTGVSQVNDTFLGWGTTTSVSSLLSPAASANFQPTSDVTLHALWQSTVVDDLTFNTQGGSATADVTGFDGTTVSLPSAPTQAGYHFAGWFAAPTGGSVLSSPYTLSGSTTLYAQWAPNATDYVAFEPQGGAPVATVSGLDGSVITLPNAPVNPGATFAGWFTAARGGSPLTSTYTLAGTTVLFAQWIGYTVTYNVGAGSNAPASLSPVNPGASVTLDNGASVTPPQGSTFAGWDCGAGVVTTLTVTQDTTCTATYRASVVSSALHVVFSANFPTASGVHHAPATKTAAAGTHVRIPGNSTNLSDPGYRFLGWAASPKASKALYSAARGGSLHMPATTVRLFGVWAPVTTIGTFLLKVDQWNLNTPAFARSAQAIARLIASGHYHTITVRGGADVHGTVARNRFLAAHRAMTAEAAVAAVLKRLGYTHYRFVTVNEGSTSAYGSFSQNRHATFSGFPGR